MSRQVFWSEDALADFEESIAYISAQDRHSAELVAARIDNAVNSLRDLSLGRPGPVAGTFEKVVAKTPFILAYAVEDDVVAIIRVIHGRRLWPNHQWPRES
ncbi:MAG: type II toxin-antitoxin system RelE/ParE family toxin [Rhodospirillaceae bacterium]